jgi:hypothetical protein
MLVGIFNRIFSKDKPIKSYQDFWTWFLENERSFFQTVQKGSAIEKDFLKKISPKLYELRDGYYYLAGMLNDGTAELILTAEGTITNMVFVEELVNVSPKIDNWKFTAHKPSLDIENVNIEMAGHSFNRGNLFFYSNDFPEYPDEIDITIVYTASDDIDTAITNGVYLFLDNFLGEVDVVTIIDNLIVKSKREVDREFGLDGYSITVPVRRDAKKELVPIEKLKSFLSWRQKEFMEKYVGLRHDTENDHYSSMDAALENGKPLIAVVNSDLIKWDRKASHPWIVNIEMKYASSSNGMPDQETFETLNLIEDKIMEQLKDFEGYLNIGRETADGVRNVYFACREFNKPSKVLDQIKRDFANQLEVNFEIYKDKYWRSFERFAGI